MEILPLPEKAEDIRLHLYEYHMTVALNHVPDQATHMMLHQGVLAIPHEHMTYTDTELNDFLKEVLG